MNQKSAKRTTPTGKKCSAAQNSLVFPCFIPSSWLFSIPITAEQRHARHLLLPYSIPRKSVNDKKELPTIYATKSLCNQLAKKVILRDTGLPWRSKTSHTAGAVGHTQEVQYR
jgi:hypothetical protein